MPETEPQQSGLGASGSGGCSVCQRAEGSKYLVISPVRDEERYVERTLESMVRQSVKPVRWIIVDDGSTDGTPAILRRYEREHAFIQVLTVDSQRPREPGPPVVHAFNKGYEAARHLAYDFIVKLDCDLGFEPDYFEQLLRKLWADPKLGIVSGVYLEASNGRKWLEVEMPPYHAAGASKVMRRACFEQIGGFSPSRGWDTVDEIRAMARGWRTGHFSELKLRHWKPEGTGIGSVRTHIMHGEVYYLTGGGKLCFSFKGLRRLGDRPLVIGGLALYWGYMLALLSARERLVTREEARCYRALLNGRITTQLKRWLHITRPTRETSMDRHSAGVTQP